MFKGIVKAGELVDCREGGTGMKLDIGKIENEKLGINRGKINNAKRGEMYCKDIIYEFSDE